MRRGENWEASRFVHSALVVAEREVFVCLLPAAMPSIVTFQTVPLASALSHQRPVIALGAISDSISLFISVLV